jgi:PBP1b-binding outer membrane lipoprotein LpoB
MKKFVCFLFVIFIVTASAWTQEPLVPKSDFGAVPRAGQSELIINFSSGWGKTSILISINGARAAHLMPGETTKIIVNNGSVSVEAQTYVFNNRNGWGPINNVSSLVLNPNSQSIQIRVYNADGVTFSRFARIRQTGIQSLQTQNSGNQTTNIYSDSNIVNAVKYGTEVLLEDIPARAVVAVISIASGDRAMTEYVIGEVEYLLVNSNLRVVERRRLDTVMQEQKFQMTGDVDDRSAVSIGKLLGANVVITGSISGSGTTRRLRLTAINVQTGEVVSMASERF